MNGMPKQTWKWVTLALMLVVVMPGLILAQGEGKAADQGAKPHQYMIISPHTMDECLSALDGVEGMGKDALAKWSWGCGAGDHTGYMMVMAKSDAEAKAMVPEVVREKAKVVAVSSFTADQIHSFHEKMEGMEHKKADK